MINEDQPNQTKWKSIVNRVKDEHISNYKTFLDALKEEFHCKLCKNIVVTPVTMICGENICQDCTQGSEKKCVCGAKFTKKHGCGINYALWDVLITLIPALKLKQKSSSIVQQFI